MSDRTGLAALNPDYALPRINRRLYWALSALLLGFDSWASAHPNVILGVLLVVPWFALYGARLHDFGRSAWWGLAAMALMAGVLLLGVLAAPDAARATFLNRSFDRVPEWQVPVFGILFAVALLLVAGLTIYLGVKRGDPAPNRYGAPIAGWGIAPEQRDEAVRRFAAFPLWFQLVLAAMALLLGGGIVYGWWLIVAGFLSG